MQLFVCFLQPERPHRFSFFSCFAQQSIPLNCRWPKNRLRVSLAVSTAWLRHPLWVEDDIKTLFSIFIWFDDQVGISTKGSVYENNSFLWDPVCTCVRSSERKKRLVKMHGWHIKNTGFECSFWFLAVSKIHRRERLKFFWETMALTKANQVSDGLGTAISGEDRVYLYTRKKRRTLDDGRKVCGNRLYKCTLRSALLNVARSDVRRLWVVQWSDGGQCGRKREPFFEPAKTKTEWMWMYSFDFFRC